MKNCPKCGETKPSSEFYRRKATSDGLQNWCKQCMRHQKRQAAALNGDHVRKLRAAQRQRQRANAAWVEREREVKRLWYLANRAKVIGWTTSFIQDGREKPESKAKRQARGVAYSRKAKEDLADHYIAQLFCRHDAGLKRSQITPELLAMKREQVLTRRLARQLKKAINESS